MNKYFAPALEEVMFDAVDVLLVSEDGDNTENTTPGENTGNEEYETPIG